MSVCERERERKREKERERETETERERARETHKEVDDCHEHQDAHFLQQYHHDSMCTCGLYDLWVRKTDYPWTSLRLKGPWSGDEWYVDMMGTIQC